MGSSLHVTSLRFPARVLALNLTLIAASTSGVVRTSTTSVAAILAWVANSSPQQGHREPRPRCSAARYARCVLAGMDTGQVLVAKPTNPHLQASTLKALSALILIPIPDKNAAIIVKPDGVNVDGTHVPPSGRHDLQPRSAAAGAAHGLGQRCRLRPRPRKPRRAVTLQKMNATAADPGAFDTVAKGPALRIRPVNKPAPTTRR
jgi:hypothetical protein